MTPQHAKIMSQPNNTPWVSISFHEFHGHIANRQGHLPVSWRFHRGWGVNKRKAHVHWEALGCMSAKLQKSSVQIIFPSLKEAQRSASAHAAMAEARHTTPPMLPAMCASQCGQGGFHGAKSIFKAGAFWTCHIGGSPLLQSWLENDPHWPKFEVCKGSSGSHFPLNHDCLRKNTLVTLNTILDHLQGLKKQKLSKRCLLHNLSVTIQGSDLPIHWWTSLS